VSVHLADEANEDSDVRRMTITVGEAAVMLGISRTSAYGCAARGEIPTIRMGRRLLVPVARFLAMLDGDAVGSLDDEGEAP
jgi:excisionase family DNA binding protein